MHMMLTLSLATWLKMFLTIIVQKDRFKICMFLTDEAGCNTKARFVPYYQVSAQIPFSKGWNF